MIDEIKTEYEHEAVSEWKDVTIFLNKSVSPKEEILSFTSPLLTGWIPGTPERFLMARCIETGNVEMISEGFIEIIQQGDKILYSK